MDWNLFLKSAVVHVRVYFVKCLYGITKIHSPNQERIKAADEAILGVLGVNRHDCLKPKMICS